MFKAIVRVEPEIFLKKYKALTIEKEIYKVTDDDINLALENLREKHATMNNIDSEAQQGNYIVADLQKTDSAGHPLIGEKYENHYFQLSGDNVNENISKQLLGVKSGDIRQISVPSSQTEQNGEEFFSVEVKEVKEKILPELDDEFAKDLGDYENLLSLKDTIRVNIEKQTQAGTKEKFHKEIVDQVIKNNPIDLPDFLVDDFLNAFVENINAENKQNLDNKDIKEEYRADAVWNLKWILLRDKISEIEEIKVEEQDVDIYIEQMVKNAGKEAAKVRKFYKINKNRARARRELSDQKVMDFIAENAKIKEKIVTHKELIKRQQLIQQ